jgi:hypothetical protein
MTNPFGSAAPIARGLVALRELAARTVSPDVRFLLEVKIRQFEEALAALAGVSLAAVAEPATGGAEPHPFLQHAGVHAGDTGTVRGLIAA